MKKLVMILVVLGIVMCVPYASHAVLVTYTLKQINYPLEVDYTGAWEYNFSMQNGTPGDIHSMCFNLPDYNPSDPSGSRMWSMISYAGLPEPWGTNNLGEAWVFDSLDDQFVHGDYPAFPGYSGQDDDLHPGQTWNFSVSCFSYAGLIPGPLNFSVTLHSVPYSEDNHTHDSRTGQTLPAAPVPEPATMLLLGTGFLGLAGFGKKLKK